MSISVSNYPGESYLEWWIEFTGRHSTTYFVVEEDDLRGLLEIDGIIHCDPSVNLGNGLTPEWYDSRTPFDPELPRLAKLAKRPEVKREAEIKRGRPKGSRNKSRLSRYASYPA